MACPPGTHPVKINTLFGGAVSNISDSAKGCTPDEGYDAFSPLKIAQAVTGVVFPLATVPFLLESAPSKIFEGVQDALELDKQTREYVDIGVSAVTSFLQGGADVSSFLPTGDDIMGFFDDFNFDFVVDSFENMVDDVNWTGLLDTGTSIATSFISNQNQAQAIPAMASVGNAAKAAAGAIAKVGPTVGRTFFNKWPNLATAIQKMRNAGHNVTRSRLHSMLKRFGPEFLVTAGIMSAAAVAELALAGPGHRRMNPANSKALRRATRRIKSFHRLCGDADIIKRRSRKKC